MEPPGPVNNTVESEIQQARGAGHPLADNIRIPMEQAFDADFSDVKIHTDSKSNQLNHAVQAKAFTTGQDVFFQHGAYQPNSQPGQKLIAHELTHVVQQAGNRLQAKHNRQQHQISSRDWGRSQTKSVIRREVEWKRDNHPDATLDAYTKKLNDVVQAGAKMALETPDSLPGDDGYTTLWKDTATILIGIRDGKIDANDSPESQAANSFGAARYGYGVEAYTNSQKNALDAALPVGYSSELQASRGMTRPDIIVYDAFGTEVGWFDITSAGSLGHIDQKTGSGWTSKRYVAEITYPVMNITNLGTGSMSISETVVLRHAYKRRKAAWNQFVSGKKKHFMDISKPALEGLTSKSTKRDTTRWALGLVFPETEIIPTVATSLLRSFDLRIQEYGFQSGGSKSEGERIIRDYENS